MVNNAVPSPLRTDAGNAGRHCPDDLRTLGEKAVARARRWADESASEPVPHSAKLSSHILSDPEGLTFATRFADDVARPTGLDVASTAFKRLPTGRTDFLPPALAGVMGLGSAASRLAPRTIAAVARRALREIVGDLVADATGKGLGPALVRLCRDGNRLNINPLGEAVPGEREVSRRLAEVSRLATREGVDYVSAKVSVVTGPHNPWGFEEVVAHGIQALLPPHHLVRDYGTFLNLDMEDYKDLDLTIAVFTVILGQKDMRGYEAGIVLQVYLPNSLGAMQHLQEWAVRRVASGGLRVKVRVIKGANPSTEKVDAEIHGWELITQPSKQATDTNYKRIFSQAMTPERARNIRLGVAGQNLFDIASVLELRAARGVEDNVEFEMFSSMATGIQEVVRRDTGHLLLYVSVVDPHEFDVAISYPVRRLEGNAASENFMSGVFDLASNEQIFNRERDYFLAALPNLDPDAPVPVPNRTQNRPAEREAGIPEETGTVAEHARGSFVSEANSDPALATNRQWTRDIATVIPGSTRGVAEVEASATCLAMNADVDPLVASTAEAVGVWQSLDPAEWVAALHRVDDVLVARRTELIEVAGSEAGRTIDQSDPEVSEAIDSCHHYAEPSLFPHDPEYMVGACLVPVDITVVASPWDFPVAIPTGGVAAALVTGSAVTLKPALPARRCAAELVRIFHDAGTFEDLVALAPLEDGEVSRRLVTHKDVDRVVLTGSYDAARLFRPWKPDMHLLGGTSGKNAIIVTPSTDLDIAMYDVVYPAFAHVGQKCLISPLLVLVSSVGKSKRIACQLVGATASLRVCLPLSLDSQMGPVVVPDDERAMCGLTILGAGEHRVLKPCHLGGGLQTPGIRAGVMPGSEFHLIEYLALVIGIMRVDTLEGAIEAVNAVNHGFISGLQTLDAAELTVWLDSIQAGNIYVNRGITGAIVHRQPLGGWKRPAIDSTMKAGGPFYPLGPGDVEPVGGQDVKGLADQGTAALDPRMAGLCDAVSGQLGESNLVGPRHALVANASTWRNAYDINRDVTALACERNVLRYRPIDVFARAGAGTELADVVRVAAVGMRTGGFVSLSVADRLPQSLQNVLQAASVQVAVEDQGVWDTRLAELSVSGGLETCVCILGPREETSAACWSYTSRVTGGSPDIALRVGAVTACPYPELLPFLCEQAVIITNHRFGTPLGLTEGPLQGGLYQRRRHVAEPSNRVVPSLSGEGTTRLRATPPSSR